MGQERNGIKTTERLAIGVEVEAEICFVTRKKHYDIWLSFLLSHLYMFDCMV